MGFLDRKKKNKKKKDGGGGDCCGPADCCDLSLFMHARVLAAVGCAVFGLGPTARRLEREPGAPRGLLARRMHLAVRYYQERISPRYGPRCRYTPTCSAYAVTALRRHGAVRGSVLTWRRLARCTPNGGRGADPVPGS